MNRPVSSKDAAISGSHVDEIDMQTLLANVSHELLFARDICINLEEVISDRLALGDGASMFVRRELQNIDRLVQIITNLGAATSHLSKQAAHETVQKQPLRNQLNMEDLYNRLVSRLESENPKTHPGDSDMTFF